MTGAVVRQGPVIPNLSNDLVGKSANQLKGLALVSNPISPGIPVLGEATYGSALPLFQSSPAILSAKLRLQTCAERPYTLSHRRFRPSRFGFNGSNRWDK